ncbi:MAG: HD domain-containing protein [Alphaproteobacteria bacterium]|nr:HD domain-containing protein [Alphaproteobacteria bacterium]
MILAFMEFIDRRAGMPLQRLADQVLTRCRELTGAEAGTIFVLGKSGRRRELVPMSFQNDVIQLRAQSYHVAIDSASIASWVAQNAKPVFVDDLYQLSLELPYRFNRTFDLQNGYRSQSMLAFPLISYEGEVIGVVQLINRRTGDQSRVEVFSERELGLIAPVNAIIGTALDRAAMIERITRQNRELRERNRLLRQQRLQIAGLQDQTEDAFMTSVRLLAKAAELNDADTGNHILRVDEYAFALARRVGMASDFCDEIHYSAALHDVGKMSVNSAILKKPGRLTDEERLEMERHTTYGREILVRSARLKMAAEIAHGHHEKWDGAGYPQGLAGTAIPIAARIVTVGDVYDALRSPRAYKPGFGHLEACDIMLKGDARIDPASHFDPELLRIFENCHPEFDRIYTTLVDGLPEMAGMAAGNGD